MAGARYIVCRNEAEAEKDRADRQAVVEGLQKRLKGSEKALIGNSAYRRYLRRTGAGKAFEIDAGKLADEARFDGIFVLRTKRRNDAAQCRAAIQGTAPGRGPVPPREGPAAHPPDLPLLRRRHPRACLLLLPRPRPPEGAGRPAAAPPASMSNGTT